MSEKSELAVERFKSGFNCAQAVFSSYSEEFGVDSKAALKVGAGFGGGMRIGSVCGAAAGAFMVLGLKYGNCTTEDAAGRAKAYEMVLECGKRFKERNGSVMCSDLLGLDVNTPEGLAEAQAKGLLATICPKVV